MTLRNKIDAILAELAEAHPELAPRIRAIDVRLSSRMTATAGYAQYRGNVMKISSVFFSDPENVENNLRNTVTHEVAHLLVGPSRRPHGWEWQSVHRMLGGNGQRCHNMPRKTPAQRKNRYAIRCTGCNAADLTVGPTRRNRMLRGVRYRHGCGNPVELV